MILPNIWKKKSKPPTSVDCQTRLMYDYWLQAVPKLLTIGGSFQIDMKHHEYGTSPTSSRAPWSSHLSDLSDMEMITIWVPSEQFEKLKSCEPSCYCGKPKINTTIDSRWVGGNYHSPTGSSLWQPGFTILAPKMWPPLPLSPRLPLPFPPCRARSGNDFLQSL